MRSRRGAGYLAALAASFALLALAGGRAGGRADASAAAHAHTTAHPQVVAAAPLTAVSPAADARPSNGTWPRLSVAVLAGALLALALAARRAARTADGFAPRALRTVRYSGRAPPAY